MALLQLCSVLRCLHLQWRKQWCKGATGGIWLPHGTKLPPKKVFFSGNKKPYFSNCKLSACAPRLRDRHGILKLKSMPHVPRAATSLVTERKGRQGALPAPPAGHILTGRRTRVRCHCMDQRGAGQRLASSLGCRPRLRAAPQQQQRGDRSERQRNGQRHSSNGGTGEREAGEGPGAQACASRSRDWQLLIVAAPTLAGPTIS